MSISQENIHRLKKSRDEYESNQRDNALKSGRYWAEHEADWEDIMPLIQLDLSNSDIVDLKEAIESGGCDSAEDEISKMFGVDAALVHLITPEQVRAFLEGVVEVHTAVMEAP